MRVALTPDEILPASHDLPAALRPVRAIFAKLVRALGGWLLEMAEEMGAPRGVRGAVL